VATAVVIGAGIAGVAAAAALQPTFDDILLIERDNLPEDAIGRRGVPQGAQLHNLLGRAQLHLEQLLPGFLEALEKEGRGEASVADETHVFEHGVVMPRRPLGLRIICADRAVIEHVAREIVLRRPNVSVLEGARVDALVVDDRRRLCGVRIRNERGDSDVIDARIVVDASGAASLAEDWVRALGRRPPPISKARSDQWYVSSVVHAAPRDAEGTRFWMAFPSPGCSRGGLISPTGGDRWYVSVNGRGKERPPRTFDEVIAFADNLPDPEFPRALAGVRPVTVPSTYRRVHAVWRRYDLLADPVPGFLPLGDAVATLNPLFGQGISVAAWQAGGLASLAREAGPTDLPTLTIEHHRRTAAAVKAAWELGRLVEGALIDQSVGAVDGARLARDLTRDPELHRTYVSIWHLLEPVAALSGRQGERQGKE